MKALLYGVGGLATMGALFGGSRMLSGHLTMDTASDQRPIDAAHAARQNGARSYVDGMERELGFDVEGPQATRERATDYGGARVTSTMTDVQRAKVDLYVTQHAAPTGVVVNFEEYGRSGGDLPGAGIGRPASVNVSTTRATDAALFGGYGTLVAAGGGTAGAGLLLAAGSFMSESPGTFAKFGLATAALGGAVLLGALHGRTSDK